MKHRVRFSLLALVTFCATGCDTVDSIGSGSGGDDGPMTMCLYGYAGETEAGDFGESCTADADCAHGTCLMPGDSGNITNEVFGFCTRACDCESSGNGSATLAGSDPDYDCVYPGGCYVGESQGAWRHAVPKCSTVSDCTDLNPLYTHCADTGAMTVVEDTCGLFKVCQAHAD